MAEFLQIFSTILFFLVYYYYDIYLASLCLSVLSVIQLLFAQFMPSSKSAMNQSSLLMLTLFGFSTWYFGNPRFIQWKITIANFAFAVFLYAYRHFNREAFFTSTFRASNMMIPDAAGVNADNLLVLFFLLTGAINYVVFTNFSEAMWVTFKTSIIFINIAYLVLITMYLSKYVKQIPNNDNKPTH